MTDSRSRRTFLGTVAAAGSVLLAGCGGSSSEETPTAESTDAGGDGSTETDADDGDTWTETSEVDMTDDLAFEPEYIEVEAGTTVTWTNAGSIGHSVTAYEDDIPEDAEYWASGGFDSQQAAEDAYPDEGNVGGGETFEHTFETKGEHKYFCIPHETADMVGYVKVV